VSTREPNRTPLIPVPGSVTGWEDLEQPWTEVPVGPRRVGNGIPSSQGKYEFISIAD